MSNLNILIAFLDSPTEPCYATLTMRNLAYLGLSDKLAEHAKRERRKSVERLDWPDNLETLLTSIPNPRHAVKLAFGLEDTPVFTLRYLTTEGVTKEWSEGEYKERQD